MSENTKIWDILGRTDPKHTKTFKRSGGFSGTAMKPMWAYRRMTEEFGPVGYGWGVGEPQFQVVPGADGEVLVYCTASVWFKTDDEPSQTIYGVGGDKVVGKNKYGLNTDDEAFKKAFTDAITNALKLIGVGADIHMGLFDDSKYVNAMKQEWEDAPITTTTAKQDPKSAASMKRGLEMIDNELLDCHNLADIRKLGEQWAGTFERDGWSEEFIVEARAKFKQRRDHLNSQDFLDDVSEAFGADKDDLKVSEFPGDPDYVSTVQAG